MGYINLVNWAIGYSGGYMTPVYVEGNILAEKSVSGPHFAIPEVLSIDYAASEVVGSDGMRVKLLGPGKQIIVSDHPPLTAMKSPLEIWGEMYGEA